MYVWYRSLRDSETDKNSTCVVLVLEEHTDGLSMVHSANGLGKDWRDVEHVQLGAHAAVFLLGNRVRYNHLVNGRSIESGNGVPTEDAVGDESVDLGSTLALEQFCSPRHRVAGIDYVVHQNADAVPDVADQHHASVALFVEFDGPTFLSVGLASETRTVDGREREAQKTGKEQSLPCESAQSPS
jgi:hypothetical protein